MNTGTDVRYARILENRVEHSVILTTHKAPTISWLYVTYVRRRIITTFAFWVAKAKYFVALRALESTVML